MFVFFGFSASESMQGISTLVTYACAPLPRGLVSFGKARGPVGQVKGGRASAHVRFICTHVNMYPVFAGFFKRRTCVMLMGADIDEK